MSANLKHGNFHIEQELRLEAPLEKVFSCLTEEFNSWWAKRLNGEESTLSFKAEVAGRFIEKAATWHRALSEKVTNKPPEEIRLNGLLGKTGAVEFGII